MSPRRILVILVQSCRWDTVDTLDTDATAVVSSCPGMVDF